MHKAIRTQIDDLGDIYSRAGGLDCSVEGNKDMARQEFAADADINNILRNFGIENQQRTMVQFGEADYTIDLQQAMHSIHDTQRAYQRMDKEIHELYPTYEQFVRGVRSGKVEKDLERINQAKIPAQQTEEIRRQMAKEKERQQLERDDEAAKIAEDFRTGRNQPKTDEKPK